MTDEQLWTIDQLSVYLQVPKKTIYYWRETGIGPKALPVGRYLRWRPSDVESWLEERAS